MEKFNIIFLDLDGVLVTRKSIENLRDKKLSSDERNLQSLDDDCIIALNKLISLTDSKIVISSSWRYGKTIDYFQQLFEKKNVNWEVIGLTPKTREDIRGKEISQWLENNKENVKSFLILDDDVDDIWPFFPDNVLHTNMLDGFNEKLVELATKILKK